MNLRTLLISTFLCAVLSVSAQSQAASNAPDVLLKQALHYGADKVIKSDDATLAEFRLEPYVAVLDKIITDTQPDFVFGGASTRGRELLSAAARLRSATPRTILRNSPPTPNAEPPEP